MRSQGFEGGALQRRNALPSEAEEVGRGESEGGRDERLRLEEFEDVHVAGVLGIWDWFRKLWVSEGYLWGVSGFQHVAIVEWRDG